MEAIGTNRITILAQAGHKATRTLINIVPQSGYDGQAAHDEADQIFRALLRGLPGYTFERIASLILQYLATHAEESGDEDVASVYRSAWFAATGNRDAATSLQRMFEELTWRLQEFEQSAQV